MKATDLFVNIRAYCEAHKNPKMVQKYARYFTEGFDAYGLSHEDYVTKVQSLMKSGKQGSSILRLPRLK